MMARTSVSSNQPFDGTLNTIGHISWESGGHIEPDQPATCGHGFAGAEGYTTHFPGYSKRHRGAE